VREKLRVVIADDERPARSVLAAMLRTFDDVEIVGEARDGAEALTLIEARKPDRLKDLEARLDPDTFIRLSRGTLANVTMVTKATPMPGGTYVLMMTNGQELSTSRFHSRLLREKLLRL
jgi:DNA-binding LytR/AlgR family response regulator